TASAAITGTVTNKATASGAFNDPASTTASANAQATVTGHVCTISLTKTPDKTSVCNGDTGTYTYVVANNSYAFTWTGSLTDDTIRSEERRVGKASTAGRSKTCADNAALTEAE